MSIDVSNPRIVKVTHLSGSLTAPLMWKYEGSKPEYFTVSTVCLEGAHLEDPMGICSPEKGYETMIFINGRTMSSVFQQAHKTLKEARSGHRKIVKSLLSGKLPIAPKIYYHAWEVLDKEPTLRSVTHGD